jgi:penicillin-binding protein 1A
MRRPPGPRKADLRPLTDRLAFKPLAVALLVPVIVIGGMLSAIILAPPFIGVAMGVLRVDAKLDALGADFTRIPRFPERSTIYANDGRTVLATVFLDNRELVRLRNVSEPVQKAVLAIEDSGFYTHGALSWSSLLRAVVENAQAGEVVQGGSTITQQLVKNTLGLDPYDQSFERKFQELALAIRVEEKYTKQEILELYLNQVYLGNGVYGIGTASEFYFHKPASKLTLREGAMLAGMIKAPADYDPLTHPHKTLVRRNDVLNRMISLGQDGDPMGISSYAGERTKGKSLGLPKGAGHQLTTKNQPFFVRYMIRQILGNANGAYDAMGRSERARQRTLFEGGLKIVTTLDPDWQEYAQTAADAPYAISLPSYGKAHPDTSIVSVEPATGAIRTMLSGKNFVRDKLDLATTAHPTGSAFKPFVLAAAFEQGVPPSQRYSTTSPFCSPLWQDSDHCVENAEGTGHGSVDLWTATEDSINVVFAQLILDIGPETVPPVAQKMGVTSELPPVASLATGSAEVSPLDMASSFATLSNGGVHCAPYTVQRILRDGKELYEHQPDCERAIPADIAHLITAMLERVPVSGTAAGAFSLGWGPWPLAGKTGTADLNKAVWFCGYTRQVATAVWVGSNGNPYSLGSVFGGTVAAPIWRSYMLRVMSGMPAEGFPEAPVSDTATVPSVVGMTSAEAIATLQAAGFRATALEAESNREQGVVVSQAPSGGSTADLGVAVQLQVSNGVAPAKPVPKVVGLTLGVARSALAGSGFDVHVKTKEVADPKQDGLVLSQSPPAGTPAGAGTPVPITVGQKAKKKVA